MRRALVLAGGGMRVAWQTGVVAALRQAGLTFDHVDGTSGGIMTAGMVLSGLTPEEMGRRWSTLDVHDFSSPLPVRRYLPGPWSLPALGDADGIVRKAFPHLGLDVDAIRRSPVEGTFNVVDFTDKTCVAVPHTDADPELLAAGMSLPLFVTPLKRGRHVWTDAVWVKDANLTEALRRGADEIWLVWCIGNTPYWGDGPLEQYVHMIEMSANGGLFAELDTAAATGREFVLHVVKPSVALPLDPEFYTGRITADTLVAMGYRDAWDYLDGRQPDGVPKDTGCTVMEPAPPGVRFRERLYGRLGDSPLTLDVTVELALDAAEHGQPARFVGHVDHAPWGGRVLLAGGSVEREGREARYRARALVHGAWRDVELCRELSWRRAGSGPFTAGPGCTARLSSRAGEAARALLSVEPTGAHGLHDRAGILARVGRLAWRSTVTGPVEPKLAPRPDGPPTARPLSDPPGDA